jgi:hypothetical protein
MQRENCDVKKLLVAGLLLIPSTAFAAQCQNETRAYGAATTVGFCLSKADATERIEDAAAADGDVVITKDEGAEANITAATEFTDRGKCYSLALTATEMQAARVMVLIEDQGTKAYYDHCISIKTFGHASSQFPTADVNVTQWNGTAVLTPDTNGAPKVTIKDGTGTGELDTDAGSLSGSVTSNAAIRKW